MGRLRTLLCLSSFILSLLITFSSFAAADDAAVMSKLLAALRPAPSGWTATTDCCKWKKVNCDGNGRVTLINLFSQSLSGILPSDLGSLSQLTSLSLQGNSFSGPLPSLANLSSLQQLYLDNNNFSSIPAGFFQGLISLQTLILSQNLNLAPWTIPTELTQATRLVTLYASDANVIGSLPDIFGSFPNLKDLQLSSNKLTGPLPKSLGGSGVRIMLLDNQLDGLSGTIDLLSSMTDLHQVWLNMNQFTGPIPDLSPCTNLFDLQLGDNQFTGIVPPSLMSISSLKKISLDNNELQGPYPVFPSSVTTVTLGDTDNFCKSTPGPCDSQVTTLLEVAAALGYPSKLGSSWQGNNACAGWSFITCDSQGKIITVNFAKQRFVGTISPAFANFTSLKTLSLNDNNLTGSIPDSLARLPSLQALDVSNNNLTGLIPSFAPAVKLIKAGNPLLGSTTQTAGSGAGPSSGPNGTTPSGNSAGSGAEPSSGPYGTRLAGRAPVPWASPGAVAGITISMVIFVILMLFVSIRCYVVGKRHRKNQRVENSENWMSGGKVFSIQVLARATENFSEDNILGRGGFGDVYKGELRDGTPIAVKKMKSDAESSNIIRQFQAELAVLTEVRHRHLVALLGYCIYGNERLLVYEYMPKGTLTQHLFEWREKGYSPLSWKQRLTIALDVARGVEYLHSLAQQSFIHRDLKPSNILLGDDMRAKVADFGLVKSVPDGKDSVDTRLAGTFGYLAPEYAATGSATTKVDVYAFGVVLEQLITGRKALHNSLPDTTDNSCDLVAWFNKVPITKEIIRQAMDETIRPDDEETMESIYEVADLARLCTACNRNQRPEMTHVIRILGPLVDQWIPSTEDEDESHNIDLQDMSLPQALQRLQANEGTSTMLNGITGPSTTIQSRLRDHGQG